MGDPVMPEDHNYQTEAIARLTDIVETIEDPRDVVLDYILLKKQLSIPTWRSDTVWYQYNQEIDRHELRFTPALTVINTIYPPELVYSDYIDLIPLNYDPPLRAGRIWFRGDIPELRFSPDGLVAYRLWPERYFPTYSEPIFTDSIVVDPYYMPVGTYAGHHANFIFPYTLSPGHILVVDHRLTTKYDASKSWNGRIDVIALDPYTGYGIQHMGVIRGVVGLVPNIDIKQKMAVILTEPYEKVIILTHFEYHARIGDPPFPVRIAVSITAYKPSSFYIQY